MKRIYLDHNATTPLRGEVLEQMLPHLGEQFGNASSIHWHGQQARRAVDRARQQVAALIGARPAEVVFTSGGTEADNLALRGVLGAHPGQGSGAHLICSAVEHPAVLETCKALQRGGLAVSLVGVDAGGRVDPPQVEAAITDRTVLISVMLANNDVGTIQPVAEIARLAHARGLLVHSDAVQAAGRLPLDVETLGVDLLSLSGHKLGGPQGSGALYVRAGVPLRPQLTGGEHERGRRAGTENVPAVVGLGQACELAADELEQTAARQAALRTRFLRALDAGLEPGQRPVLHGDPEHCLANTLNLGFGGIEGEALLMNLDLLGVAVSNGSACSSGTVDPSHVLLAMGLSRQQAAETIRVSMGRQTTAEELDAAAAAVVKVVQRLGCDRVES